MIVVALVVELVGNQVLVALVFEVDLGEGKTAARGVVVFGGDPVVPVVELFNRLEAADVVPNHLDQLAKAVEDLLVDDRLLGVVAPANVHHPPVVLVVVVVNAVGLALPLWVQVEVL